MDGLARCLRYAFGPNRLHLCGPEASQELFDYFAEQKPDRGLALLLKQFKTMYPYLKKIAEVNKIEDPFDERVVEAYWLGNELLDNIRPKEFYQHLQEDQQIKKRISPKEFEKLCDKLNQGAKMHHSFHVFNVWKRTGNDEGEQTIESMDKCRISWGEIVVIDGPFLTIKTKPLILKENKLTLGPEIEKKIIRRLSDDSIFDEIKVGDIISIHWEIPCEILTKEQAANLEKYTRLSLALANQTL